MLLGKSLKFCKTGDSTTFRFTGLSLESSELIYIKYLAQYLAHRMRRGTAVATSSTMIMRMLLTPVSTPCAQDTVFLLLNPITEPLPRDGCWLGVHSHCSILSASNLLAPLLPRLLLPLAEPVGNPSANMPGSQPWRNETHPLSPPG